MGKSAIVIDRSMMNAREAAADDELNGGAHLADKAFDDMTDLKNEDFIFVY